MDDARFSHIKTDPKFRRIPKNVRKLKIGKRFQSMFKDQKFKVKYTVDKRGRPVSHTSTEDLRRYYDLSSEDTSSDEETAEADKNVNVIAAESDLDANHNGDKNIPQEIRNKLRDLNVDYARGEATLLLESSSDEESDAGSSEEDQVEHNWGELDNDAEHTDETTNRLAACNMDWDRIRAVDLMVLFNSFLPSGGAVKSVVIYPSEFGKARITEEEIKGPTELVQDTEEVEDNEEGAKYHMEKLRQYQLNRLRYYYAVVTCDSVGSANKIYTECDGMEYESSATKMDLRFIPNDMTFEEEPKEECNELPEHDKYQPRFFTTTALQQAKVDLTWDETAPERIEITQKLSTGKVDDISENDLHTYIAMSDKEESDDDSVENFALDNANSEDPIDKYKQILQEIENKEKESKRNEIEMEVTWGINLKDKAEKFVKDRMDSDNNKTPFERYLDKRKEKRKEKRKKKNTDSEESDGIPSDVDLNDQYFAEEFNNDEFKKKIKKKGPCAEIKEENDPQLELLLMDEHENKSHFSLKNIQKQEETASKKKRKHKNAEESKADDFKLNVNDKRFSALYTSHLYNIDPTDPHYKKTRGMEALINEKIVRRTCEEAVPSKEKTDAELSVLIKSVKRKTKALIKKQS